MRPPHDRLREAVDRGRVLARGRQQAHEDELHERVGHRVDLGEDRREDVERRVALLGPRGRVQAPGRLQERVAEVQQTLLRALGACAGTDPSASNFAKDV